MDRNFHEFQERADPVLPSERSTGLVFTVACLLAAFVYHRTSGLLIAFLLLASIFAVLSFSRPATLKPLNTGWFQFGKQLHKITNPIVMGVLFVAIILPFGVVMQLRHDPLRKRRDASANTYWIGQQAPHSMRNQF